MKITWDYIEEGDLFGLCIPFTNREWKQKQGASFFWGTKDF